MGSGNSKQAPTPPSQVEDAGQPEVQPAPAVPRVHMVLLGASGVGKSCLMQRYVRGQFVPNNMLTVGVDYKIHPVQLPDGTSVKFCIWDTPGVQRSARVAAAYIRIAVAAAVVYDITDRYSLTSAKRWVSEVQEASNNLVLVLVGNKTDLARDRVISEAEGQEYASSQGMLFVETSAKTAANTSELFELVARQIAMAAGTAQQPAAISAASSDLPAPQATA